MARLGPGASNGGILGSTFWIGFITLGSRGADAVLEWWRVWLWSQANTLSCWDPRRASLHGEGARVLLAQLAGHIVRYPPCRTIFPGSWAMTRHSEALGTSC